jgi:hypothetical protein
MGKYFKYALGEIMLVVIGILIALQINNWNEDKKDRKMERNYLSALKKELIADTSSISMFVIKTYKENFETLEQAKAFQRGSYQIKDTIAFLNRIGKSKKAWSYIWTLNTNVFKELESTGSLRKIKDSNLRYELTKYYSRLYLVQQISDKSESNFRNYIDASLFFNNDKGEYSNEFEIQLIVKKLKDERFYEQCNLELVHSQNMYTWALNMTERATELLKAINEQIETNK